MTPPSFATSSTGTPPARTTDPGPGRRVVDAPTRVWHGLFALTFAGAYATAESEHWRLLHVTLGHVFTGLMAWRVLYGVFGPRHAGLAKLWRRVGATPAWLRSLGSARSVASVNWRQGQHLAMGWIILALLAPVVPLVLSGYALYGDWADPSGFAGEWLEDLHESLGQALLVTVAAHLALLAGLSLLRRRNQALPMLTGRMPGKGPDLVPHDRAGLAVWLLIAVVAFLAWSWREAPSGWTPGQDAATGSDARPSGPGPGARHEDDDD